MIKSAKMILMEYGISALEIHSFAFVDAANDNFGGFNV